MFNYLFAEAVKGRSDHFSALLGLHLCDLRSFLLGKWLQAELRPYKKVTADVHTPQELA